MITYDELIYSRENKVTVWKGYHRGMNQNIVVKTLYFTNLEEANEIYKEVMNMMRFKDIDGFSKVHDCQISQSDNQYLICIIMDYYKNGDLKSLGKQNRPFGEKELMFYLKSLIDTLSNLQEKGIAHRDIKPENIFIDDEEDVILGDLGCATLAIRDEKNTLAGTPLYFSPALRHSYGMLMSGKKVELNHDFYKSDVYSLGLTLLYLLIPNDLPRLVGMESGTVESNLKQFMGNFVNYYPTFLEYILWMVTFDEAKRPDFKLLSERLLCPENSSKCMFCKQEVQFEYYDVGYKYFCQQCYMKLLGKNQNIVSNNFNVRDIYGNCLKCLWKHEDTKACLDSSVRNYECDYTCHRCKSQGVCRSFWIECKTCGTYCMFCLQSNTSHLECVAALRAVHKKNWGLSKK